MFSLLKSRNPRGHSVDLDGVEHAVQVSRSARAKRLTLRILPGGKLKVTVPNHVGDAEIASFLARNQNWLATRMARLPERIVIGEGSMIPFRGVEHEIVHLDRRRGVVEAKPVNGRPCLLVPGEPAHLPRKLVTFLKREARRELDEAVAQHAASLAVRPKSIRITDTTSRWGSCSTTRTLSFSWRIIMAPPEVLDYLAAHEVAHLREMNHSDRFWDLVREICPDMERHKAWLRSQGNRLHSLQVPEA